MKIVEKFNVKVCANISLVLVVLSITTPCRVISPTRITFETQLIAILYLIANFNRNSKIFQLSYFLYLFKQN